jgi:hypothetical protein
VIIAIGYDEKLAVGPRRWPALVVPYDDTPTTAKMDMLMNSTMKMLAT